VPNGIDLILADHERVNDLFERFDSTRQAFVVGEIMDALTAHDDAEHSALYPLAGHVLGDVDLLERAAVAHSAVKRQMDRIRHLEGQPLVDAVQVLRDLVTEHVQDEETNLLPALRERATAAQLEGLGARIEQTKQRVG
jgi:hemerythrin superfamily protein